jgi:hypothetical protein
VPSATQLDLQRGGGDERLRTRATVLSAALGPAAAADLQGLRAGISTGRPTRWLLLRGDGRFAPAEQLPAWQQLLSPVAAGLLGAARRVESGSARFACLLSDQVAASVGAAVTAPPWASAFALAALCSVEEPGWPTPHAARCLGIPCELPALSAELHPEQDSARTALGRMAMAYGLRLGPPGEPPATVAPSARLPLLQSPWGGALALAALRARAVHERVMPLFVEASGAQQSGQVAACLQSLLDELLATAGSGSATGSATLAALDAEWTAELRYQGQAGTLSLRGIGTGGPAGSAASDLVVRFVAEHARVYGFSLPECPVELVQLRLRAPL